MKKLNVISFLIGLLMLVGSISPTFAQTSPSTFGFGERFEFEKTGSNTFENLFEISLLNNSDSQLTSNMSDYFKDYTTFVGHEKATTVGPQYGPIAWEISSFNQGPNPNVVINQMPPPPPPDNVNGLIVTEKSNVTFDHTNSRYSWNRFDGVIEDFNDSFSDGPFLAVFRDSMAFTYNDTYKLLTPELMSPTGTYDESFYLGFSDIQINFTVNVVNTVTTGSGTYDYTGSSVSYNTKTVNVTYAASTTITIADQIKLGDEFDPNAPLVDVNMTIAFDMFRYSYITYQSDNGFVLEHGEGEEISMYNNFTGTDDVTFIDPQGVNIGTFSMDINGSANHYEMRENVGVISKHLDPLQGNDDNPRFKEGDSLGLQVEINRIAVDQRKDGHGTTNDFSEFNVYEMHAKGKGGLNITEASSNSFDAFFYATLDAEESYSGTGNPPPTVTQAPYTFKIGYFKILNFGNDADNDVTPFYPDTLVVRDFRPFRGPGNAMELKKAGTNTTQITMDEIYNINGFDYKNFNLTAYFTLYEFSETSTDTYTEDGPNGPETWTVNKTKTLEAYYVMGIDPDTGALIGFGSGYDFTETRRETNNVDDRFREESNNLHEDIINLVSTHPYYYLEPQPTPESSTSNETNSASEGVSLPFGLPGFDFYITATAFMAIVIFMKKKRF